MNSRFEEILRELGTALDIELHPDLHGACKLISPNAPPIQIEYNEEQQTLLVASFLTEVPPGKFRENVFKISLKSNQEQPHTARLGFCAQTNQLALFQFIPASTLSATTLQTTLAQFIDKAIAWKKSVETGDLLSLVTPAKSTGSGLFGIPK